jgi:putative protein-disulfide isomerase
LEPARRLWFKPETAMQARLIYIHDPMCSWCWAFSPLFTRLRQRLPEAVRSARLLGGLAPDDDAPMPSAMRDRIEATWRRIAVEVPGTRFNFAFWTDCKPRRSTWPACRAVIAARSQDPDREATMIRAIQQAYYLEARNPSDQATLIALAAENGLDADVFAETLDAPSTRATLADEIALARRLGVSSFPSLRLQANGHVMEIPVDYRDPEPMRKAIIAGLATR